MTKNVISYPNYDYNPTHFSGLSLHYKPKGRDKERSFSFWQLQDGTIIALFQGSKGDNIDIDFIVKFLLPGKDKRIRTPENMHWIVDLVIKHQTHPNDVKLFVEYFNDWYRNSVTFSTVDDRNNYELKTPEIVMEKYGAIMNDGSMSIAFIGAIIELFTLNEKLSPREHKMFEKLLRLLEKYCNGEKDYFQLISGAKAGFG